MYTLTGVTGHVGAVTARELLDRGAPVLAVVRHAAQRDAWVQQGAEVAVADFTNQAPLAEALRGSDGAFILLPTIATAGDAEHRQLADSIAAAAGDRGVRHVLLSSIGADVADVPTRMVATSDVGKVAAETLLRPPSTSDVIDLEGHEYTLAPTVASEVTACPR